MSTEAHARAKPPPPSVTLIRSLSSLEPARELVTLRALYALSDRVASAGSLQEIHEAALDALMEAVAPDRASVLAYDAEGVMRFRAWRALSDPYRRAVDGHSPWTRGSTDPQPILVADVAKDESLRPYLETFRAEGIAALAFIPLVHQRRLLGKFMLYHNAPHVYSEDEVSAARAIATHVAAALARREAQNELDAARLHMQRLEKAAALGSLVGGVAHEIRTPLTSLVTALHLIEARAARLGDPTLGDMSGNLVEEAMRINRLVEDLRRFTRPADMRMTPQPLDVTTAEAIALFASAHPDHPPIVQDLEPTGDVLHDRFQLQQVVINLLDNAAHASAATKRPVRVSTRRDADGVTLAVQDEGAGMPPEVKDRIWEEFYTTKPEGTGLGLSIVRRIVAEHGARIACESAPGRGTTFTVTFPR